MKKRLRDRLAVCSWSLRPAAPADLIERMREIGLRRIQCALDPMRSLPEVWADFSKRLSAAKMEVVSGMFGCVGEDYSTLESIRRTGGIVPDATWDENWENIQSVADIAKKLKLKLVTFHAGFLPHDSSDPAYSIMLHRLRLVAGTFAAKGIQLALETGQETAETLSRFLEDLGRPNVGVNFDPANMVLYDKGDPIEALRALGPWLRQCHLKDAVKTQVPGEWGKEVTVGTGDVDWSRFFETLAELDFTGPLCFEREAGDDRVADIRAGREFVEELEKSKPLAAPVASSPKIEPVTEPAREPVVQPPGDPATEPPKEPAAAIPASMPAEPASEPMSEPPVEPALEPIPEAASDSSIKPVSSVLRDFSAGPQTQAKSGFESINAPSPQKPAEKPFQPLFGAAPSKATDAPAEGGNATKSTQTSQPEGADNG